MMIASARWLAFAVLTTGAAALGGPGAAAQALRLGGEIGSLEVGAAADVCVWDVAAGPVARRRHDLARDLHERIFAWMTLGDDRNLVASWVAGRARGQA